MAGFLIGLLVYKGRTEKIMTEGKAYPGAKVKKSEPLPISSAISAQTVEATQPALNQPHKNVGPLVMSRTHGAPADYAIVTVAYKHPELHLQPDEAADLQDIFSAHFALYSGFQAKMARAAIQEDGSTLIQIPAFPTQMQQLADELLADIRAYYNGNVPPGVAEAILEAYRGCTNSAGHVPVNLTVRVSNDPNYSYEVIRETLFGDPATGKVTGRGASSDVLTKNGMLDHPYSDLIKLFPKPKG